MPSEVTTRPRIKEKRLLLYVKAGPEESPSSQQQYRVSHIFTDVQSTKSFSLDALFWTQLYIAPAGLYVTIFNWTAYINQVLLQHHDTGGSIVPRKYALLNRKQLY